LPPWNLIKPTDRKRLSSAHANSIKEIASQVASSPKYRKRTLVPRDFSYTVSVIGNKHEMATLEKKNKLVEVVHKTQNYNVSFLIPTGVSDESMHDLSFVSAPKLKGAINQLFQKAKNEAKRLNKPFSLVKYHRKFSYTEFLSDPMDIHDLVKVETARSRANQLQKESERINAKRVEENVKSKRIKQESIKMSRANKVANLKPVNFVEEKKEPVKRVSKRRIKQIARKQELVARKTENALIRKSLLRRKEHKKKIKEIPKEEIKEDVEDIKVEITSSGKTTSLPLSTPKKIASQRTHDRNMRRRRIRKEEKELRVLEISANKKSRRQRRKANAKKRRAAASFTAEALTSPYDDSDESSSIEQLYAMIEDEDNKKSGPSSEILNKISSLMDDSDPAITLICFISNLLECRTSTSVMSASYLYLSSWGLRSSRKTIYSLMAGSAFSLLLSDLLDKLKGMKKETSFTSQAGELAADMFDPDILEQPDMEDMFPGFSPSRIFDTILSWGGRFFTSDVYLSLKKFVLSLVSLGMFEKDSSKSIESLIGRANKKSSILDCAQDILNSLSQLIRSGEMIVRGYPLEDCFFSKDPLTVYIARTKEWMANLALVVQGIPPEGKIHIQNHVRDGKKILEFLKVASTKLNPLGPNYVEATDALRRMEVALPMLRSQLQSRSRPTPLAVCISGPPGIGKSTIITMISFIFSQVMKVPWTSEMIFHRTPSEDFWEGFDPDIHHIVHISEVGAKSDKVMEKGDPAIAELTSVIDSQPYAVPMAFEGKGKIFCLAGLIIIDTNEKSMGLEIIQKNPAAFRRRFLYIEPNVRPEFKLKGSFMLDPSKGTREQFLDKWSFVVSKEVPQTQSKTEKGPSKIVCSNREVFSAADSVEFAQKFSKYVFDYVNRETMVQKAINEQLPFLAKHCHVPDEMKKKHTEDTVLEITPEDSSTGFLDEKHYDPDDCDNESDYSDSSSSVSFSAESFNPASSFVDLACYVLYKTQDNFTPEVFLKKMRNTLKEQRYFFGEAGNRYLQTGSTIVNAGFPLVTNSLQCLYSGIDLYLHSRSKVQLFNPYMWATLILPLILYAFTGYLMSFVALFAILFTSAPYKLWELRRKSEEYRSSVAGLNNSWNNFRDRFSNNCSDIMVLPVHVNLISVLAIAMTTVALFRLLSKSKVKANSEASDVLTSRNFDIDKKAKVGNTLVRFRETPESWNQIIGSIPKHTSDLKSLFRKVSRNVKKAKVISRRINRERLTHLIGVSGNVALINTHALMGEDNLEVQVKLHDLENSVWKSSCITPDDMIHLGNDCTLILLSSFQFCDISSHFLPLPQVKNTESIYKDEILKTTHYKETLNVKDGSRGVIIVRDYWTVTAPHGSGNCGNPLISQVQGGCSIVGIHTAGGDECDTVVFSSVPDNIASSVKKLVEKSGMMKVSSESMLNLSFREEMNKKSMVRFEDMGNISIYGTLDKPILVNQKSKLKKTLFYKHISEMLFDQMDFIAEEKFCPPPMRPFRNSNKEWISPYNLAINKINRPRGFANRKILRKAIRLITRKWLSNLKKNGVVKLEPISLKEAVNGALDDYYTRKIDLTKSGGFGYPGKKSVYFESPDGVSNVPTDKLMERVIYRKEKYLKGESCPIVFTGLPKDEPRLISKARVGKTRLFYAGMLDSLVVAKQFLSPFYTLMAQYRLDFGCAIGVDAHREANSIAKHLLRFSDSAESSKLVEGDYQGYDVSMCPDVTWAAYTIIMNILESLGYSADALKIVNGLLSDFMHPFINILGDVIMAMITPSGKYGTAEDNSVKGVVIIVIVFISHPEGKDKDPFEFLVMLVYGDDMLVGVHPLCLWFDNFYFAKACKDVLGMTFTSATKGEHDLPHVTLLDASFLRRSFIRSNEGWRMPLTLNSTEKTIGWILPSRSASEEDQVMNAFNSFLREVFLGTTEERFNKVRDWGMNIFKNEYNIASPILQKYEEIYISLYGSADFTTESMAVTVEEQHDMEVLINRAFSEPDIIMYLYREHRLVATVVVNMLIACESGVEMSRLPDLLNWPTEFKYYMNGKIAILQKQLDAAIKESQLDEKEEIFHLSRSEVVSLSRYGTNSDFRKHCDEVLKERAKIDGLSLSIGVLKRAVLRSQAFSTESAEGYLEEDGADAEVKNENLIDMSGGSMDIMPAMKTDNVDVGQDVPLSIKDFLSRPIRIAFYTNSPTFALYEAINPWDAFLSQPSVRAKLRNTAYLRANLHLRISVSGMPFHYGRYIFSYIPFPAYNEPWQHLLALTGSGTDHGRLVYLSQSPYARSCDVISNEPVEMVIPYLSPQPVMRLFNNTVNVLSASSEYDDASDLGVLYIKSINTLASTTATSTAVSIAVYAWMEDVEFGSPTATQIAVTTESDERIIGPISSTTKSMSEAAKSLSTHPIIGSYAKASGKVLDGASDMASALGWSYPTLIDEPMRMKNEPFQNAAVSIGMDTGKRIVLDPKQELSVDMRNSGSDKDDLVIQSICSRESLLDTFSWTASDSSLGGPNRVIGVTPMCARTIIPGVAPGDKIWVANTPLSLSASFFNFWRGEITYRIEFVCSMYHRGKMLIGYEPNIAQHDLIDTVLDTNKNYIITVDLQETRCIEFTVQWANARPWLSTGPPSEILFPNGSSIDPLVSFKRCNGYIYFTPLTQLQSPDGGNISVNVYVRSDNMHFNAMDLSRMPTEFTAESTLSPCDPSDKVILNPTSASLVGINEHYFGEEPLSFRSYLRRFCSSYRRTLSYTTSNNVFELNSNTLPLPYPNFGEFVNSGSLFRNLFTYLRYCYLSMRGGIRKRIVLHDSADIANAAVLVSLLYEESYLATDSTANTDTTELNQTGGVIFMPYTNQGIEFEIPWYSSNTWGFAQTQDYFPTNSIIDGTSTRRYNLSYALGGANRSIPIVEYTAIAEDFMFSNFIAAYPMVIGIVP